MDFQAVMQPGDVTHIFANKIQLRSGAVVEPHRWSNRVVVSSQVEMRDLQAAGWHVVSIRHGDGSHHQG
jgi:hypothetical protein